VSELCSVMSTSQLATISSALPSAKTSAPGARARISRVARSTFSLGWSLKTSWRPAAIFSDLLSRAGRSTFIIVSRPSLVQTST
jgi:hypothetical protein